MDNLQIAQHTLPSRLFLGSGKFESMAIMEEALRSSAAAMVTMALKRVAHSSAEDTLLQALGRSGAALLPNTSGARTANEACLAAELAREAFHTNWIKLEIHPDPRYLMPDPIETLYATERLAKAGFVVLPYIHADPVLCKRLEEVGTAAVMPLAAPIGSNKGVRTADFLAIIIEQSSVPVIVDAGLGAPSEAAKVMEMGADAVLVNTAIATAKDPTAMARAFSQAVIAGRAAFCAGLAREHHTAQPSSPLTDFLHQNAL